MLRIKNILLLLCTISIFSCIENYEFEAGEVAEVLVIDAELRDSLSLQSIKISYQNEVGSQRFIGVNDVTVVVRDDLGEETIFTMNESGVYTALFGADRDRTYQLQVTTEDGKSITSSIESVPPPIDIDSIVFEELQESFVNEDGKNRNINVVKAYGVANIPSTNEDLYVRFGNLETVFLFQERKMTSFPPSKTCYVYDKDIVREIGVFEITSNSQESNIRSLLFTKPISWELGTVFSVKADLISMTRPYYEYWKEIENVYSQNGNINNAPPAQIRTNLKYDDNTAVIGYFAVTSASSELLFIRKTDLTTPILSRCGNIGSAFPFPYPEECGECLLIEGASTTRPEYW